MVEVLESPRRHQTARAGTQSLESHVTTAEISAGIISPLEAYGNEAADKLAARGALRNALSMEHVAATRNTDSRVRLVQTRLIEINLVHVQNRTKTIRVRNAAPERRAKFDPDEAMRQLNRIGHDFRRIQVGKGRFTYKCRFCLLRGEKPFLKQLLGKPCSVVSRVRSVALPPIPVSTPIPEEPESFFIGDNPSSEEDPFGWGGDFDQDHQDMSDQALQSNPIRSIQHDGMNPDCSPEHTMDQVEPGDATMEDPEPDEAPSGSLEGAYTSRPDIDNSSFSSGGLTPDLGEELRKYCPKSPECISDSIGPAESGSSASQSVAAETTTTDSRDSYSTTDYTHESAFSGCSDPGFTEHMSMVAARTPHFPEPANFASRSSPETHESSASERQRTRSPRHHGEQWELFGRASVHLSHAPIRVP